MEHDVISNSLMVLGSGTNVAAAVPPQALLDQMRRVELKSQSRNPVSQAVARSWTTAWHPYRS